MQPAKNLREAVNVLQPEPFWKLGMVYADLSTARGSNDLAKLENRLREAAALGHGKCHLGLRGHRGSGKSTELLVMEKRLVDCVTSRFTFISTRRSTSTPTILISFCGWLNVFAATWSRRVLLGKEHSGKVAGWFAEVTRTQSTDTEAKMEMEAEAEATAKYGIFGTGLKLLARVKSAFIGSTKRRLEMREELQRYAQELLVTVNNFLDHASAALKAAGLLPPGCSLCKTT